MQIIEKIKSFYRKEQFVPSLFSILINPNFIVRRALYKGIKKHSSKLSGSLMDMGCGTKPYRFLFTVKEYTGVDIHNEGHKNDISKIDVFYDGKQLPFQNEQFNSVFCTEAITHIFEPNRIIGEISRVLKKDGLFLLTAPFVWHENEKPIDSSRYTSFGIKYLLETNGFEIIEINKTTTYFETVSQMWASFLFHVLFPSSIFLKIFFTIIFISPVNFVSFLFSPILPQNSDLFSNTIVLARKQ